MAVMIPSNQNAQYFGFFNLSGKATSFLGTFLFGAIVATTGSSRIAIFSLLPLFAIGALLMLKVNLADPSNRNHQGTATPAEEAKLK
jgi:UMF1 family MFS transporter